MVRRVVVGGAFTVLVALPALTQTESANDAIRRLDRSYDQAFIEADAPPMLTKFFANDATIISPRGPIVNGEKAVAAFWTGIFKAGRP